MSKIFNPLLNSFVLYVAMLSLKLFCENKIAIIQVEPPIESVGMTLCRRNAFREGMWDC